jgi:serine/threonine protein kinase
VAIELDDTAAAPPSADAATEKASPAARAPSGVAATERAPVVADGTATDPKRAAAAASPNSEELPAGMRLGHFQLVKKLGAGGMGEVYLATDLALDRPVALKVLPSGTSSGTARERLIREARSQARVQHSNVGNI